MCHISKFPGTGGLFLLLASVCVLSGNPILAQDGGEGRAENYKVSEEKTPAPSDQRKASADQPQRLARIEYVHGNVTWRPDEKASWKKTTANAPLREGAQVWVTEGGRAEIRFDDGSLLRLGKDALATLKSFYRDDEGEFTQIKLLSGLATLLPKHKQSLFQVETPLVSIEAIGPARVRIGVADTVEVGVRQGLATVEGKQGKTTLNAGDFLSLRHADSSYALRDLPPADSWERWNDERDRKLHADATPVYAHPVYTPRTSVWFSLDIPLGPYYRNHWPGRGIWRRWR